VTPLWRVGVTADVLAEVGAYVDPGSLLSPPERERHDRLRQAVDRDDFVAARALARLLVLGQESKPVSESALGAVRFTQRCASCGGPHGRPEVVGRPTVGVSWAHAKGVVGAAVSDGPVGVDVERVGTEPPPGLTGDDTTPWLAWARAEALTKLGAADLETALSWEPGLSHPASLAGINVDLPDGEPAWLADGRDEILGVVWALARAGHSSSI
jgi:4'-phosphopantetheinyl transferase